MNQIFIEAKKLINSNGNVWLWKSETVDGVCHFLTAEDAQKYIELLNKFYRENGRQEQAYSIGTEADFMAAARKFERNKKANEVKEYCKRVDELIEHTRREIKALDGIAEVCQKFDGKVLNKRFCDAVKDATNFIVEFGWYSLDFFRTELNNGFWVNLNFSISADWSHGKSEYSQPDKQWQWNRGERLEAEKALVVIEYWKNYRLQAIRKLTETKKQYAAYLKLARKAEKIFKDMADYDFTIRMFAKDHALSQHNSLSNFWRTY